MKTHQQRMLQAIEAALENWVTPLEMTWDQSVASNVGYVGAVWPGEVVARKRLHVNFQADYATFKEEKRDRTVVSIWFSKPNANEEFKKVLAYLCGEG